MSFSFEHRLSVAVVMMMMMIRKSHWSRILARHATNGLHTHTHHVSWKLEGNSKRTYGRTCVRNNRQIFELLLLGHQSEEVMI